LSVVLRRQLQDRRFEAAGRTAAQQERVSVAMAATLAEILEHTRRDVRSFDWMTDVPKRLQRAHEHAKSRIEIDGDVVEHVMSGMDTESDVAVRQASGELVETLRRIRQVHLDLATRAAGAREVFLAAQIRQVFSRPVQLRLLNVEQELFGPVLALPTDQALGVAEAFGDRVLGLRTPRLLHLNNLIEQLLAPPRTIELVNFDPEDPGEDDEVNLQSYPPAVVAAATRILRQAQTAPATLTDLVIAAANVPPDEVDGAVDDVTELVSLAALWAYSPDAPDPGEVRDSDLQSLIAALSAQRADGVVDTPTVWGDELTVIFDEVAEL
jgi:hypothetical protein